MGDRLGTPGAVDSLMLHAYAFTEAKVGCGSCRHPAAPELTLPLIAKDARGLGTEFKVADVNVDWYREVTSLLLGRNQHKRLIGAR